MGFRDYIRGLKVVREEHGRRDVKAEKKRRKKKRREEWALRRQQRIEMEFDADSGSSPDCKPKIKMRRPLYKMPRRGRLSENIGETTSTTDDEVVQIKLRHKILPNWEILPELTPSKTKPNSMTYITDTPSEDEEGYKYSGTPIHIIRNVLY